LKEFTVCYTFDNNIIIEKMIKNSDVKKEDVEQEVIEKMDRCKYFIVKNDQGIHMINSYLVRYIRVINEKIFV
jgi:predicted nucleic acid-binding protein